MEEIVTIVVVFGSLVLLVDQIRRLIAHVMLNRTLREALRHAPEHVPALIEKVEQRPIFPLALGGWVFLGLATVMAGLAFAYGEVADPEFWTVCGATGGLGAILLGWSRFNERRTRALTDKAA